MRRYWIRVQLANRITDYDVERFIGALGFESMDDVEVSGETTTLSFMADEHISTDLNKAAASREGLREFILDRATEAVASITIQLIAPTGPRFIWRARCTKSKSGKKIKSKKQKEKA